MPDRMGGGQLPHLRLVDMSQQPKGAVLAPALVAAMTERAQRGEQSLILLNRRGYAPVLSCHACGWKSHCPSCSAYRVFHKIDRTLRCHHCGFTERVPRACPDCGNIDITPVGKGTEQLEEQVSALLSGEMRPDGQPLRVARMDADTTREKGSLEAQLARMHSGEVDVLVGTQMVAKGHDFRRITLVAAINADSALFAADYRAPRAPVFIADASRWARRARCRPEPPGRVVGANLEPDTSTVQRAEETRLRSVCPERTGRPRVGRYAALHLPGFTACRRTHPGSRSSPS
jgi:primosomal protein N' (replication factor Y)